MATAMPAAAEDVIRGRSMPSGMLTSGDNAAGICMISVARLCATS